MFIIDLFGELYLYKGHYRNIICLFYKGYNNTEIYGCQAIFLI